MQHQFAYGSCSTHASHRHPLPHAEAPAPPTHVWRLQAAPVELDHVRVVHAAEHSRLLHERLQVG